MLRTALPAALLILAIAAPAPSQDGVFEMRRTADASPVAEETDSNVISGKAPAPTPTPTETPEPTAEPTATPEPPAPVSKWRDLVDTPTMTIAVERDLAPSPQPEILPENPAAPGAVPKVGFVDIETVLDTSRAIREIMREVDREMAEDAARIDDRRREAQRLRVQLEQQGSVLSESQRQARQQEILDILNTVDEMEYRYRRKMEERQRTTVEPLLERIIAIVGDVGRREKFDLIVRGEIVLYGRGNADLTQKVVTEVDKRSAELRQTVLPSPTPGEPEQPQPLPMVP